MTLVHQNGGWRLALVPRTAALFILLYQIRLLAADLADTPFFAAVLIGALMPAIFLYRKKLAPLQALIIIALVPWVIRFFIALPRWFINGVPETAILLDSLLLNLDRNNFSALLPFYWVAVTTYFSLRSRVFLRADIISADTLFMVIFSIAPTASMDVYRWPILMIALFILIFFFQIISLILSMAPELKLQKQEAVLSGAFLFILLIITGALFIRPFQEKAVERGGGLLEPKLFRFDFSQILKLESEISVNDDLVLIVKKDPDDSHILLRRFTLSGYNSKQGFFRAGKIDEAAHPQRLPGQRTFLPPAAGEIKNFRVTNQEYYLVNFDASAFIGMNMPVQIIPFETWDASSFNSAYAVISHTSEAMPFELFDAVQGKPGHENLGMSAEEYSLYTEYGNDEAIRSFALEIINSASPRFGNKEGRGAPSYWEQIQMIYDRLKYGEYRYSLKPGIAPGSGFRDEDPQADSSRQLKYFLFNSKKGYCSYYAFAFTLLLRSLGIPCRVAAGFFVDQNEETFNYYPVRADMAHAWVEVWFPGYGWIEYDPTSEIVAEGEDYRYSQGTPPELFERLMKEILDNRSRLREKNGDEAENGNGNLAALGKRTMRFFAENGVLLAAAVLGILFLVLRSGFLWLCVLSKDPRRKARYLWLHTKRRLSLAGLKKPQAPDPASGEAEWAKKQDGVFSTIYSLYLDCAAARFAPDYTLDDNRRMAEHYRIFDTEYRRILPLWRRLIAWLFPPLALFLRPARRSVKAAGIMVLFILLFLLRGERPQAQNSQAQADSLYENALTAQTAENWERAIDLFTEGFKTFPQDFRFPWSLGNLYYQRSLYHLAWDEFRRAEKIRPGEPELLLRLANTAGYLNRNEVSADYFERLLKLEPDNKKAIGSLAWMYFKLHRLEDGKQLLLNAIERLGQDEDFSMTLATIYSDMFQYTEAKESYLKAIKGAQTAGDRFSLAL